MGTTYAIGSDGNIELPSGFNAQLQSWSCNISRSTQVVTGFTDTGQRRKQSTLVDVTGSAGAIPIYNASTTQPFNLSGTTMDDAAGGTVSLFVRDNTTAAQDVSISFNAVFSSYAFSVEQDGAQSLTFNFEMADDSGPTLVWFEA